MLITNIDELKSILPTIVGDDYELYRTYVDEAELYLEKEILGSTLYATVVTNKANPTYSSLVKYSRSVIAHKAYHVAIPFLDVVQTNTGFAVTSSGNLAPASRDRVRALRDGIQFRMYDAIEILLRYLDANKSIFTGWATAPYYTTRYDVLVYSAKLMQQYVPIGESHRLYLQIIPNMKYAEDLYIHPLISKDLVIDIKTKIKAGTALSAAYTAIYDDLLNAEANLTIGLALERHAVVIDADKVILNYVAGEKAYLDSNRMAIVAADYIGRGKFYLNKVIAYINANLDDFDEYTGSDVYTDRAAGDSIWENDTDDAIFVGGV